MSDWWGMNYHCLRFMLSVRGVVIELLVAAHISSDTVVCPESRWLLPWGAPNSSVTTRWCSRATKKCQCSTDRGKCRCQRRQSHSRLQTWYRLQTRGTDHNEEPVNQEGEEENCYIEYAKLSFLPENSQEKNHAPSIRISDPACMVAWGHEIVVSWLQDMYLSLPFHSETACSLVREKGRDSSDRL